VTFSRELLASAFVEEEKIAKYPYPKGGSGNVTATDSRPRRSNGLCEEKDR
jgi:hypothetical protein